MAAHIDNYIQSSFVASQSGKMSKIFLPETGEPAGEVAESDIPDLYAATQVCAADGEKWEKMPMIKRVEVFQRLLRGFDNNAGVFEKLLVRYLGYSFPQARLECQEAVAAGQYILSKADRSRESKVVPRGLLVVVMSTVSPCYYFFDQVLSALLTGNQVILKPHPQSGPVIDGILKLVAQLGIPHSVIQAVYGESQDILQAMVEHPAVRGCVYTGRHKTGIMLNKLALDNNKFFIGQYGGRNSIILGREVNFLQHGHEIKEAMFATHFLSCFRGSRVFVHEKNYTETVEKLTEIVESAVSEKYTGCLSTEDQYDTFWQQVQSLREEQVNVAAIGKSYEDKPGYRAGVHIVEDMKNCSTFQQDQSVGPLVTLTRYKAAKEAIKFANTSPWGLAGYIFNHDIDQAKTWAEDLRVGHVFVNQGPARSRLYKSCHYSYKGSGQGTGQSWWDLFQLKKAIHANTNF